jgi:hypothetical protein
MVKLSFQSDLPKAPLKKRINGELRDFIISDLEQIAAKHRVALSTIAKMAYAEVRGRNA